MAYTPWLTSNKLIESIKRKIAVPVAQNFLSDDDILAFCNEEMMISQVPSILSFNEEYFVYAEPVSLLANKNRYPIPTRAIGMKLRDIAWRDANGNLYEMVRINAGDKAYFQNDAGAGNGPHKFYLENNDVVLDYQSLSGLSGTMLLYYYRRPNQLVTDDRAAIITGFSTNVTVSGVVAGDTLNIGSSTFTAVASSPGANEFVVGGTDIATATNLVAAINTSRVATANNGSTSTNVVNLVYTTNGLEITGSTSFSIPTDTQSVVFSSIPSNIVEGALVDLLQTRPGHKFLNIDVSVPQDSISGSTIAFTAGSVPSDMVVGDYICLANECIIPQIPPDLHNGLAERASARILAALGDQAGLQAVNQKIAEIEKSQGFLVDSRVDGSPPKILNRFSPLRVFRTGSRRRF